MVRKIIFTLIVIFASTSFAGSANKSEDQIVAKVNGKPVYESQIEDKIKKFLEFNGVIGDPKFSYNNLSSEMKKEIIKNIVLSDLVLAEAKKSGADQDPEFKKAAEFTANQLLQKFYIENLIKSEITEDKIKAEYKKYVDSQAGVEEYKVAHILVKTEEEAQKIKKRIDAGEDFSKLAQEYSLDNKEKGGELDYFIKGQMVAPFEQATEKLKVGQVSGIVKTDFGYHIIKLLDKRKASVLSLDDMREKIKDDLAAEYIQDFIKKLEAKNKVEYF